MKRLLVLLITVFAFSGCQSQQISTVDPFFGRTRVAPPGTGTTVARPSADPYYRSPAASPTTPPLTPVPQNQPAASYQSSAVDQTRLLGTQGSRVRVPAPARSLAVAEKSPGTPTAKAQASWATIWSESGNETQAETACSATAASSAVAAAGPASPNAVPSQSTFLSTPVSRLAGRERIVRTLQPRPAAEKPHETRATPTLTTNSPRPSLLPMPEQAIDIMDLPKAGATTSAPRQDPGFRLASGASSSGSTSASPKTEAFSTAARYGHDPNYAWLRGKLEYSQIDRRWKLRYIPIDGDTDQYGGSVVLNSPSLLGECERGDFVEIRGTLRSPASEEHGYAPLYEAAELRRLDEGGAR